MACYCDIGSDFEGTHVVLEKFASKLSTSIGGDDGGYAMKRHVKVLKNMDEVQS